MPASKGSARALATRPAYNERQYDLFQTTMVLSSGSRLGPYEILGAIGVGGMGEVYRARDTRLGREVAVKVLPQRFAADPDRLRRFEHEAQAVAALNHPHICQLYDIGPGYMVLEYVDGRPLRGPMNEDEAVRLALQVASALEAAHRRGILHRDLKPANIVVTPGGSAKLLDFGLAKLTADSDAGPQDVTRTLDGVVLGTASYMSPEQAQGRPLDARSDIFSLGAVLYEAVTGRRAFDGTSAADVLSAVLRDDPRPIDAASPLARIISRCLAKQAEARFATMSEVRRALEQLSTAAVEARPSIAVLPFANLSADPANEYFSDGLAEEIINSLTRVPGLKVIARTSAFAFKGRHEDVRRIAEALGVAHVLEGSVRKVGNRVRVNAQLITAADGSHLWSERYDRELEDIFAIQDEIASAITEALRVRLSAAPPATPRHVPDMAAYDSVLMGRHLMLKHLPSTMARARQHFVQAIELDPSYPEPHAQLGLADFLSVMMGKCPFRDVATRIRARAEEALSLAPDDPGPHFLLGAVAAAYDFDWPAAAAHFSAAVAGRSTSAEAHWAYASLYLQPLGHFRLAVHQMQEAVGRDPLNLMWRGVLVSHLTHAGLIDRAIQEAHAAIEIDPSSHIPRYTLGEAYTVLGRWRDAADTLREAYRLTPQDGLVIGTLAGVLRRMGDRSEAEVIMRSAGGQLLPVIGHVLYHALAREIDEAAEWYDRAIAERDPFAPIFAPSQVVRELRQSSHWPRLAARMHMEGAGPSASEDAVSR